MIKTVRNCRERREKMNKGKTLINPGSRKEIIHPRLCTCRKCKGIGFIFVHNERKDETQRYICKNCNGTGRVKVRVTILTEVQPFIPGEDDKTDVVRI